MKPLRPKGAYLTISNLIIVVLLVGISMFAFMKPLLGMSLFKSSKEGKVEKKVPTYLDLAGEPKIFPRLGGGGVHGEHYQIDLLNVIHSELKLYYVPERKEFIVNTLEFAYRFSQQGQLLDFIHESDKERLPVVGARFFEQGYSDWALTGDQKLKPYISSQDDGDISVEEIRKRIAEASNVFHDLSYKGKSVTIYLQNEKGQWARLVSRKAFSLYGEGNTDILRADGLGTRLEGVKVVSKVIWLEDEGLGEIKVERKTNLDLVDNQNRIDLENQSDDKDFDLRLMDFITDEEVKPTRKFFAGWGDPNHGANSREPGQYGAGFLKFRYRGDELYFQMRVGTRPDLEYYFSSSSLYSLPEEFHTKDAVQFLRLYRDDFNLRREANEYGLYLLRAKDIPPYSPELEPFFNSYPVSIKIETPNAQLESNESWGNMYYFNGGAARLTSGGATDITHNKPSSNAMVEAIAIPRDIFIRWELPKVKEVHGFQNNYLRLNKGALEIRRRDEIEKSFLYIRVSFDKDEMQSSFEKLGRQNTITFNFVFEPSIIGERLTVTMANQDQEIELKKAHFKRWYDFTRDNYYHEAFDCSDHKEIKKSISDAFKDSYESALTDERSFVIEWFLELADYFSFGGFEKKDQDLNFWKLQPAQYAAMLVTLIQTLENERRFNDSLFIGTVKLYFDNIQLLNFETKEDVDQEIIRAIAQRAIKPRESSLCEALFENDNFDSSARKASVGDFRITCMQVEMLKSKYQQALENTKSLSDYQQYAEKILQEAPYTNTYAAPIDLFTAHLMTTNIVNENLSAAKQVFIHYLDKLLPQGETSLFAEDVASVGLALTKKTNDDQLYARVFKEILGSDFKVSNAQSEVLLFNLACYYALNKEKEKMLEAMGAALESGQLAQQFREGSDFSFYLDDAEFKQKLAEYL